GMALWPSAPEAHLFGRSDAPGLRRAVVAGDLTPELLGVGFIIGPRIAAVMFAGGLTAWLGLIPLIDLFGAGLVAPVFPEAATLIRDMDATAIWSRYVRYIGAGAVAAGGMITLARALPLIRESLVAGLSAGTSRKGEDRRTDRDLPLRAVLTASAVVALVLWWLPFIEVSLPGAAMMVVFSFFFVTVSARIVGLIGS